MSSGKEGDSERLDIVKFFEGREIWSVRTFSLESRSTRMIRKASRRSPDSKVSGGRRRVFPWPLG